MCGHAIDERNIAENVSKDIKIPWGSHLPQALQLTTTANYTM